MGGIDDLGGVPPQGAGYGAPPGAGGGFDWRALLTQLAPANSIPTLLHYLVPGLSGFMDQVANDQSIRADQARYMRSNLASYAPYQAALASGANPANGGAGWGGFTPFSIFPQSPGGPGPNLPPEMQRNLAFQVAPGPEHTAYTNALSQYHAPGMVPEGLPVPTMTEPLARSWLLQTQAAQGGFPGFYPGGGPGSPGGLPIVGATWDPKRNMWIPHTGIPPAPEKQPEVGIGPPEDLTGGRTIGGGGAPSPARQLQYRNAAGPKAGEAVAAFTDPTTGQTVAGGVMLDGSTVRGANGRDYQFTDQGIVPAPTQGNQPTPAQTRGTPVTQPPVAPATPPAAPGAAPAASGAPGTPPTPPAPAAGAPAPPAPGAPGGAPAGTPPATGLDADEQLLFGTPPASGTGFPSSAPSLPPGVDFQAAPGTAAGATTAATPSSVQTQGEVQPPTKRADVTGKTTTQVQPTADTLKEVADATANDLGLQSYLKKNYGTLYPAPADVLRDPNIIKASENWKAQRIQDAETFKASLKLNATDQAQVRRALNAKQNVEQNFLAPLGFDKNGVVITPLSASPSPTGAEFTRITEGMRHITGGGPIGGGIRLLGELGHMASPGGEGLIPGMPAEWATVEQMAQRPGVWGLAATRLMAGLSNSVLIARAIGETGRVNQQELNLLQNILIPSASDSEYRNRAKAQLLIGMLDSIAKGLNAHDIAKDGSVANANQQIRDAAMAMDPKRTQAILGQGVGQGPGGQYQPQPDRQLGR